MKESPPASCPRCGGPREAGADGPCLRCLAARWLAEPLDSVGADDERATPSARQLGGYELLEELGRGGMGVVFRARQPGLGREVAVKLLRDAALATDAERRRFRAEAASAARLAHPHIVGVHEVGEADGQPFLVMELVPGRSLADVARDGPLPARRAAELVTQLADAVQHAHGRGVLHRDLKPANVLLDADGAPRLTDFGLARPLDTDSSLTGSGHVLGTPGYLAPEQARGGAGAGPAADVYGLGAVLFHLLAGRAPFAGGTAAETLAQVLHDEPLSPRLLNPAVPPDLAAVCLRCLRKDPRDRYASAGALAEDLRRFLEGRPTLARPAGPGERLVRWARRAPALAAALAATALVTVLGFLGVTWQWLRAEQSRQAADLNALQARQTVYAADMLIVQQALAQGDPADAVDLLLGHEPKPDQDDFRGWEWWYLAAACLKRIETNVSGMNTPGVPGAPAPASTVFSPYSLPAFAPDNRTIAYGNERGATELWDAQAGRAVRTLPAGVNPLGFADDGRTLITAAVPTPLPMYPNQFGGLEFWDVGSGTRKRRWTPASTNEVVSAATLSPDGKRLATGDTDGRVTLRNAADGTLIRQLDVGSQRIWNLVLSPDGRVLGVAMEEHAKLWWLEEDRVVNVFGSGAAMTFAPDGQTVATGYFRRICLWQTASGEALDSFLTSSHLDWMAFAKDGKTLACCGGSIELWNVATRRRLAVLQHGREAVYVGFSPDGRTLVGGKLGEAHVWTAAHPDEVERLFSLPLPSGTLRVRPPDLSRIPPRAPGTPRNLIDLSAHYSASLLDNWQGAPGEIDADGFAVELNNLAELPPGMRTLAGVPFDVRGLIQVGARRFPRKVTGIPVGFTCRQLHFLHGATFGMERNGTRIGSYRVHFANGEIREIPIVLGRDLLDWWSSKSEAQKAPLTIAWTGSNEASRSRGIQTRLYKTTWRNPLPDQVVESIDFVWAGTQGLPFLVALTAE